MAKQEGSYGKGNRSGTYLSGWFSETSKFPGCGCLPDSSTPLIWEAQLPCGSEEESAIHLPYLPVLTPPSAIFVVLHASREWVL